MPKLTVVLGAILIALGLVAYFLLSGDTRSVTALIPAFLGAPILVLGLLGSRPGLRKHLMHAAVVLAVLGVIGTMSGLIKLPAMLTAAAEPVERPRAIVVQSIMCVLCLAYVIAGVRSFIVARTQGAGP